MYRTSSLCSVTTSNRLFLVVPGAFAMYRHGELTRYQSLSLSPIMSELCAVSYCEKIGYSSRTRINTLMNSYAGIYMHLCDSLAL